MKPKAPEAEKSAAQLALALLDRNFRSGGGRTSKDWRVALVESVGAVAFALLAIDIQLGQLVEQGQKEAIRKATVARRQI